MFTNMKHMEEGTESHEAAHKQRKINPNGICKQFSQNTTMIVREDRDKFVLKGSRMKIGPTNRNDI